MPKIMIVDDDTSMVKLLQTLLELDGFEVTAVIRGGDVLPKVQEVQPDLIMMDYHLTDMDGVDIIRDMRADPTYDNLPIIVASGLDVEDEVMDAGATRFIVKPFEPGDLPGMFNELIQG
ncbi:MAG: response regulator [Chloroflexi bacterium]|nr:response regulator [Chloroflexota bacterium]